jgi:hypothetical protein
LAVHASEKFWSKDKGAMLFVRFSEFKKEFMALKFKKRILKCRNVWL